MVIEQLLGRVLSLYEKFTGFLQKTYIDNLDALLYSMGVSFAMVLTVWLIEIYYVGWKESGMRRVLVAPSGSTVNDIVLYLLHISGAILILAWVASLGIPVIIRMAVRDSLGLDLGFYFSPFLHLLLYLFVLDFFLYWHHRLMHMFPSLWEIHAYHHSASEFNAITVLREHPIDKAINSITSLIPAVLLGVPVEQYPIFITIYGIVGFFRHTRIPWRLGWVGKYVIQSPVDHWIHHSNQREHYDTNFANVFSFWDWVFGTSYKGNNINTEIGLSDKPYNQRGWVHDLVVAQISFIKVLCGRKSQAVSMAD